MGWDIERIVADDGFDVEDLMFNCIWVEGMYILAQMAERVEQRAFLAHCARQTEDAVLEHCWDDGTRMFHSLAKGNEKIRCVTVSNLFPLLLPRLPKDRATSIVGHLTNPKKFWTSYPIPSVAVDEPTFDPDRTERLLWRGGSWVIPNWLLVQGLVRQNYRAEARKLSLLTVEMVERGGFWEFYHPGTGKGMRVPRFGMSTLAVTMPSIADGHIPLP